MTINVDVLDAQHSDRDDSFRRHAFCPDVNFFCTRDHLDEWRSEVRDPEGETRSGDEAAELGRRRWSYLTGKV